MNKKINGIKELLYKGTIEVKIKVLEGSDRLQGLKVQNPAVYEELT